MATTTRHGWATPDDSDRVADGASAIRSLGSAIDSAMPILQWDSQPVSSLPSGSNTTVTFAAAGSVAGIPVVSSSSNNLRPIVAGNTASLITVTEIGRAHV